MEVESSKVKTQKDLRERCYKYSVVLVKFLNTVSPQNINRPLIDQVLRSGTSIGANVTEAKSSSTKREYIRYYEIALKSANETVYWLGLLSDALDIRGNTIQYLMNETKELANILAASILTMKNKRE